jgi:signal transduction histidine kinase
MSPPHGSIAMPASAESSSTAPPELNGRAEDGLAHELRTALTIARGHLEVLRKLNGGPTQEVDIALDELGRIEHILERLLLLAKSKQPDFVVLSDVDVEPSR